MIADNGEQFRTKAEPFSPRSSPRRQDTTGTLKTTITLGKNPSIVHSGPFYLMKEPANENELTGEVNLMSYYGLEHTYNKFTAGKRLKESLSSFMPYLPGNIDIPGNQNDSSLRSLINKPPICGKDLLQLTNNQLIGFRLNPVPLPYQYRDENHISAGQKKHKSKHKKSNKYKINDLSFQESSSISSSNDLSSSAAGAAAADTHEKKHKKQKKHEDDKERKKRKKEKKKKKQKHNSPEHSTVGSGAVSPSCATAAAVTDDFTTNQQQTTV